jgi:hypothetical protein
MALQRLGDKNMDRLIASIQPWKDGSYYEQRAAAAALCEPRLLKNREHARSVIGYARSHHAEYCGIAGSEDRCV